MDIDLLSRMVKEVVMDHDTVTLPGVGSFVTELVPATFADRVQPSQTAATPSFRRIAGCISLPRKGRIPFW